MKDYKNRSVSLYREPKALSPDIFYSSERSGNTLFLAFILFVLLGTSLFVYTKIKEKDNVFYHIYSMIFPEKTAVAITADDVGLEDGAASASDGHKDATVVDNSKSDLLQDIIELNKEQARKDQLAASSPGASAQNAVAGVDANAEIKPVEAPLSVKGNLFLVRVDRNDTKKIALTFVEKEIQTTKEKYFYDLITQLLALKSLQASDINTFDQSVLLKSATVENNVLMLDFSKEFEYSKYGMVGLRSRVQQILWTVFSNSKGMGIDAVSFTIEGQRKESIGDGYTFKLFYSVKDLQKQLDVSNV